MPVKIRSFGGPVIWFFRKHCSGFTSRIMLSFTAKRYDSLIREYIRYFMEQCDTPLFMNCMIETVNRCNGTCEFCPANIHDEDRPFKKMSDDMFKNIIFRLKEIGWTGKLYLGINNEPFLDKRILKFAQFAKDHLPGIQVAIVSNGTLLSAEKMDKMVGKIDEITINDYSGQYNLAEPHKTIYYHVKKNACRFKDMNITINRRYKGEILATRAGNAPNKPEKNNKVGQPCIYPFVDFLIFPDGKVGMCCNDCKEISNFGDITQNSFVDIWRNRKFQKVREAMYMGGRINYPYCKECDVVDAGGREQFIKGILKEKKIICF